MEIVNAGHVAGNARWEAQHVANVLDYYAGAPERMFGRQIPVTGGINITFQEPIGVVGVIVPWNFPMSIATWGFAPAMAAGCTVLLKPAEYTPLGHDPCLLRTRGRHPRGRAHRHPGRGPGGRAAVRRASARPQGRLRGLNHRRQEGHGRLRRSDQARHPRTRRGVREHRVRRLGPRDGGRDGAIRRVRQCRPGLLRPVAHPRPGHGLRTVHGAPRARRQGRQGRRSWRSGVRDGADHLAPAVGPGLVVRHRRCHGRVPGLLPGGRRLLVPADRARVRRVRSRVPRGDLRAGGHGRSLHRRG